MQTLSVSENESGLKSIETNGIGFTIGNIVDRLIRNELLLAIG